MEFDDLADDGETDAGALDAGAFGAFGAVELAAEVFDFFGGHAHALVGDGEEEVVGITGGGDADGGVFRGVFDGVGEEIVEGVFEEFAVGGDGEVVRGSGFEGDVFAVGEGLGTAKAGVEEAGNGEGGGAEVHLPGREAFNIEESGDHLGEPFGLGIDHLSHLFAFVFWEVIAADDFAGALNGGERGAHFVGDEVEGLLVAGGGLLAGGELAADVEEAEGGAGGEGAPGGGDWGEGGQGEAAEEGEPGEGVGGDEQDEAEGVGDGSGGEGEGGGERGGESESKGDRDDGGGVDDEGAVGDGLEGLGVDFDAGHGTIAVEGRERGEEAIGDGGKGGDADEDNAAAKGAGAGGVGE